MATCITAIIMGTIMTLNMRTQTKPHTITAHTSTAHTTNPLQVAGPFWRATACIALAMAS